MTKQELKAKAEEYRKLATQADQAGQLGMRTVYLKKARNYYEEAGLTGSARWCERWLQ